MSITGEMGQKKRDVDGDVDGGKERTGLHNDAGRIRLSATMRTSITLE